MAGKSNIRSMRFSDEIIEIIEAQPGETFTAKFEGLVRQCVTELPQKQRELQQIRDQITRERESLQVVRRNKQTFTQNLSNLQYSMESLVNQVNRCTKVLEGIKE